MCVVRDSSVSIMAAAKDEPDQDVLDQDEPSSTGTECAFSILSVPADTPMQTHEEHLAAIFMHISMKQVSKGFQHRME